MLQRFYKCTNLKTEKEKNKVRNCHEINQPFGLSKCPSAASENLDVARYACDFLLCR